MELPVFRMTELTYDVVLHKGQASYEPNLYTSGAVWPSIDAERRSPRDRTAGFPTHR